MTDEHKKILKFVALALIAMASISVLHGITNLADIVERFIPGTWVAVFIALVSAILILIAYPVWCVLKLPRAPLPPKDISGPAYEAYQGWISNHLKHHSDPVVAALAESHGVEEALANIHTKADALIFETARQVFIETALSQNGKLDGLLMLGRQIKLVWRVCALYELRPIPERLWYLYSNVAMASLLSSSLEEMDLDDMVKPLMASVLPAAASAIPGMQTIATLAVGSALEGTANALLTLRLGELSKQYSLPLIHPTPQHARKQASSLAYVMLSRLTQENVSVVIRAFVDTAKDSIKALPSKVLGGIVKGAKANSENSASSDAIKKAT